MNYRIIYEYIHIHNHNHIYVFYNHTVFDTTRNLMNMIYFPSQKYHK